MTSLIDAPRLTPTSVAGVWHTEDHRFMAGPLPSMNRWVLEYWPTGLYTPGHHGPVRLNTTSHAHTQQLIDWIWWAETMEPDTWP